MENAERMREDHKRRVAALQQLDGHRTDCLRYATHLADVDELEGAADMCNKVVTDFPGYAGLGAVLFFAAAVLKALKQYAQAVRCFEMALDRPPEGYREEHVLFQVARVYELQGERAPRGVADEAWGDCFRKFGYRDAALRRRYGGRGGWRAWHDDFETWSDMAARCTSRGDSPHDSTCPRRAGWRGRQRRGGGEGGRGEGASRACG